MHKIKKKQPICNYVNQRSLLSEDSCPYKMKGRRYDKQSNVLIFLYNYKFLIFYFKFFDLLDIISVYANNILEPAFPTLS